MKTLCNIVFAYFVYPFLCRDNGFVIRLFRVRNIVEYFVRRSSVEVVEVVVMDIGEYLL